MYQNYNTGQTNKSVKFEYSIPKNHIIHVISNFIDTIPPDVLFETTAKTGRPAYNPAMMLKILLFAYSRNLFWS